MTARFADVRVVGVAFAAGAITHVLLFIGYGFFRNGVIGNAHLPVYVVVIGFTPIIWRLLGGLRRRRSSTRVAKSSRLLSVHVRCLGRLI